MQHLDEIRPAGLLGYFCRFARLRRRNPLQQVPIVRVFHHDAKSRSAVLHKALFVGDDVRMPISGDEKSTYELGKTSCFLLLKRDTDRQIEIEVVRAKAAAKFN